MASRSFCSLLQESFLNQNSAPTFSSSNNLLSVLTERGANHSAKCSTEKSGRKKVPLSLSMPKRQLNLTILAATCFGIFPNTFLNALLAEELELERYTDNKEGFTFLRPSSWRKVDKAGATVLFEDPNSGSNNVGIVVNPVRLVRLGEFGSPEFVADKLIQAERRKESTKEAEVIGVAERTGQGGLQVYEFEYKIDSSRGGLKRIFSAVFVTSKKLYLLNINHSDKPESPLDLHKRMILEQVLHSFDAIPSI